MKQKKNTERLGLFNILLVGRNQTPVTAISIADNTHAQFKDKYDFNIVEDMERDVKSNSWFNEFVFVLTSMFKFNNIVISEGFGDWMEEAKPMERIYMKKLLQAMNFVIVDVGQQEDIPIFDKDIPQCKFDNSKDFFVDYYKWIGENMAKVEKKGSLIGLVRSMCGKSIPYLGDVFGCLSGKTYTGIVPVDTMRFDVPILFDEFCYVARGYKLDELDGLVMTRTNSVLSAFFK